jgi:hypothetical protein
VTTRPNKENRNTCSRMPYLYRLRCPRRVNQLTCRSRNLGAKAARRAVGSQPNREQHREEKKFAIVPWDDLSNRVSADCGLRCRETGFPGRRKKRQYVPEPQISGLRDQAAVQEPRQFGAKVRTIRQRPRNAGSYRSAWWWMQPPSNRSPRGNSRLSGKRTGNFVNSRGSRPLAREQTPDISEGFRQNSL